MMHASKANKSVSECLTTGLCIKVKALQILSRGNTYKPFKCDRGPTFQVTNERKAYIVKAIRNPLPTRSDLTKWQSKHVTSRNVNDLSKMCFDC